MQVLSAVLRVILVHGQLRTLKLTGNLGAASLLRTTLEQILVLVEAAAVEITRLLLAEVLSKEEVAAVLEGVWIQEDRHLQVEQVVVTQE